MFYKIFALSFFLIDNSYSLNNGLCVNEFEENLTVNHIFCELRQICFINSRIPGNHLQIRFKWKKSTQKNSTKHLLDSTNELVIHENRKVIQFETTEESMGFYHLHNSCDTIIYAAFVHILVEKNRIPVKYNNKEYLTNVHWSEWNPCECSLYKNMGSYKTRFGEEQFTENLNESIEFSG